MTLERRGVNHAQLWWVAYDAEKRVLEVQFNRVGHYTYEGVPDAIGCDIMTLPPAEAVALFDDKVEGKYKSTRLGV